MKSYHYITPLILQKIGYIIFLPLLKFFVRIEFIGTENLKNIQSPIILASNHTSELDPVVFALILSFFSKLSPFYFVANPKEKFKTFGWRSYFYGGAFFNMLGAYPIISGKHNYEIALQHHLALLRRGRTVCIFPEGRRTNDGKLSPGHGGVAYLSYTTQSTVIPIAIDTLFNINLKDFLLRRRKVVVRVGQSITAKEIFSGTNPTVEDFKKGGQMVMDRIGEMIKNSK